MAGQHVTLLMPLRMMAVVIGRRDPALVVILTLVGGLLIGVARAAQAEPPSQHFRRDEPINFNIPSEPLADALYAYTAVSGVEALAAGTLLGDRRSSEVHGTLTVDEALQALLMGTGLIARFVDSGSFTLAPIPTVTAATTADGPSDVPRYASYSTRVQNAVRHALCRQTDTRPGYYRTAIQIWIAPSGVVARAVLVGTTGDIARDKALSDLFRTLSIGAPPPAGLPQPATLLILPRAQTSDCASADRASVP